MPLPKSFVPDSTDTTTTLPPASSATLPKSFVPDPIQSAAPQKEPSFWDKLGNASDAVLSAGFNVEKGIAKGVADTVGTVPMAVNKVVSTAVGLKTDKDFTNALDGINKANDTYLHLIHTLPDGDARKQKYLDGIKTNNQLADQIRQQQTEVNAQIGGLQEKPGFLVPKGTAEKVGYGAEKVGEFVYAGAKGAKPFQEAATTAIKGTALPVLAKKAAQVALTSGIEGVTAGGVTAAQGGDLKDITRNTIISTLLAVPFKTLDAIRAPAADYLQESAQKKATQALAPTTRYNKQLADKVVPEMLDRKVTYLTRGGLYTKATENADEIGAQIGDKFNALPDDAKTTVAPIFQDLEKAKTKLFIEGTTKVPSAAAGKYKALQNIQSEILDLASPEAQTAVTEINNHLTSAAQILKETPDVNPSEVFGSIKGDIIGSLKSAGLDTSGIEAVDPSKYTSLPEFTQAVNDATGDLTSVSSKSLRSMKQILDQVTREAGQGFGFTGVEKASLMANKAGANSIRDVLASDYPDIAKLNKEYTFWKNVQEVVGNTIQRTKGQGTPLGETVAEGAGAVAGATLKGKPSSIVLGATGLALLKRVVTSPAWRNTSAIIRNQLADNIANGNAEKAIEVLNRIIEGTIAKPKIPPQQ